MGVTRFEFVNKYEAFTKTVLEIMSNQVAESPDKVSMIDGAVLMLDQIDKLGCCKNDN